MSEATAVSEKNTVEEIDAFAEEKGIEVSGTKPEKLAQIEAAIAEMDAALAEPEPEPEPETPDEGETGDGGDDLPEPETEPAAPEPGEDPKPAYVNRTLNPKAPKRTSVTAARSASVARTLKKRRGV